MCITIGKADLEKTLLLANSVEHDGRTINVIGYQNVAKNRERGPNAMILPFPSADPMTQENCVDLSDYPDLLKRYASRVRPRYLSRGLSNGVGPAAAAVEVFDSGSYTVVLAADAVDIPEALERVPEHKRPQPHPELFHAYGLWYPGWSVALCCWDGAIEAEPLLWWYRPLLEYRDQHFLPGLDGHDGKIPDPGKERVSVDHVIAVGSYKTGSIGPNSPDIVEKLPTNIKRYLPDHVYGGKLHREMRNGDWVLPKEGWTYNNADDLIEGQRRRPPGYETLA